MDQHFDRLLSTSGDDRSVLESWFLFLRVKNLRPDTMVCYADRIGWFLRYLSTEGKTLRNCTRRDVENYVRENIDKVSPETTNGRIRVLRVFYKWACHELPEEFSENPLLGIKLLNYDRRMKNVLTPDRVAKLVQDTSRRNRAMILLMFDGMIRLKEIRGLMVEDVNCVDGTVVIRYAKSRHARLVPIGSLTSYEVKRYIASRQPTGLLFPNPKGGQMSKTGIMSMMVRLSRRTGIAVRPHLLRHSGATAWLRSGGDSRLIQRAMGLRTAIVLDHYLHVGIDALSEAKARADLFEGVRVK